MTQGTRSPSVKKNRSRRPVALPPGLAARQAALEALLAAEQDRLDSTPRNDMSGADRGLVRAVVMETLRRRGQIDALIDRCLHRPLAKDRRAAQWILRLATAELLFLDHPAHAVLDTAVELAKRRRDAAPFARLINAVLRRLQRDGAAWLESQDAAKCNTPAWLWDRWSSCYGAETARSIAEAHLTPAPLDITVANQAARWAQRLDAVLLATGSLRRPPAEVTGLDGYADGAWWVQDAAAALPARLLGSVAGQRVADLCAAPGGKTLQLAAAGARVTAVDKSPARLEQLEDNLARTGLQATVIRADLLDWTPTQPFEAILLDAPCSATGTIRRHPDLPALKTPKLVRNLAELQARLLARAANWLAPGGRLVYSTCSLEPEEGEAQIAAFLAAHDQFARQPVSAAEIGGWAELISPKGDLRVLPCHRADLGGLDGFFAARLVRR